jgi:hypothetical protein
LLFVTIALNICEGDTVTYGYNLNLDKNEGEVFFDWNILWLLMLFEIEIGEEIIK